MSDAPLTVSAKWLGGKVSIPALFLSDVNYGDIVDGLPATEAAESDLWEVVTEKPAKKKADD